MTPTFVYGTTTVSIINSVPEYDWGESQDLEHASIITGNKTFTTLGDYATVSFTVYLWKMTSAEQDAIKGCRGKEGVLTTDLGNSNFRCTQIKYGLYNSLLPDRKICVMTFKSMGYV